MTDTAPHITIVAGGEENDRQFLLKALEGDFWCADRGYLICRAAGRTPSLIIGDLDSLQDFHVRELELAGAEILRFPPEKDESDLELALREAQRRGYRRITFLGMVGGRLDHALFNLLAILGLARDLGLDAVALSSQSQVRLLGPGTHVFGAEPGAVCSLLPLTETVESVELQGFRYILKGETLRASSTRSLSNIVDSPQVQVSFSSGRLLVVLPSADSDLQRGSHERGVSSARD